MAGSQLHDGPADLDVARLVLRRGMELLEADPELYEKGWDEYETRFSAFMEACASDDCCQIDWLRYSLEQARPLNDRADICLAAMKCALSAFVLARENPYYPSCRVNPDFHSDIDPVVRRALDLMNNLRQRGPGRCPITWNQPALDRLEKAHKRSWLEDLIDNAVTAAD